MTDKYHFSTVENDVSSGHLLWPHGARIIASQSFGIATIENRKAQIHINPRIMCRIETACRVKGKTNCPDDYERLKVCGMGDLL